MVLEGMIIGLTGWMLSMSPPVVQESNWLYENQATIQEAMYEARDVLSLDECEMNGWMDWDSEMGMVRTLMRCEDEEYIRWAVLGIAVEEGNYVFARETIQIHYKSTINLDTYGNILEI